MRIAFSTLGCKINQYETDVLQQDLASRGNTIVPFEAEADIYIINTCTVTAKSDYQCRQTIRSAVRRGRGARVIVTGCYAETRPDELRTLDGVDLVLGNSLKASIPDRIMKNTDGPNPPSMPARSLQGRTRGFLKIQDGCDNRCSYCIVPSARGGPRSVATESVIKEFERLVRTGCPEIVLSGIHIGKYGVDLDTGIDLTGLLKTLIGNRGGARIRLSSIEPREITPELIGFVGQGLCRHLHIPLQSGDDAVLSAMKRNYTAGFYRQLLVDIANSVPGIALGADVMVGFPGEGDAQFLNTVRLIENSPLSHLHVFSFSPRPGTPAAEMKNQVPEKVKKHRSEILRELGGKKNTVFRKKYTGCELLAIVENKIDRETGFMTGITDNYIRLTIQGAKREDIGKNINIRIDRADSGSTTALMI